MHALLNRQNLDVHIFESASAFKEAGAAIGVTQNARRALKLIGASTLQCLEDAGAVSLLGIRYYMARGLDSGREFDRLDATDQPITNIVHRADFLRELLKIVPSNRMHTSKQLVDIDEAGEDGPVTLSFSDGTTHECDVLIGADGIHTRVRRYVLGEGDPAATPVPAGWWFVAALKPYDEALEALGKEFLDLEYPVEYQFSGEGAWWMHNSVSRGSLVQCLISVKCDGDEAAMQWKRSISADEIREIYRDWPSPIKGAVEKVCLLS
jgi:salicylate hydroxylase